MSAEQKLEQNIKIRYFIKKHNNCKNLEQAQGPLLLQLGNAPYPDLDLFR